jgi:putative aldouronate transport system substrate-binding protein
MKKIIYLIFIVSTVVLIIGCRRNGDYDIDNFLPNGTNDNPYQIVKETITVNIFVPRGSKNPPYATMKMFQKLSEVTNLTFEFTEVDVSAYTQVRSAAWEDKRNLPDLFLFNNSIAEQVTYSQFGALVSFNDDSLVSGGVEAGHLINNYMPIYKDLLENNFYLETEDSAIKTALFEDGMMYSTLSVNNVPRDLTFKMFMNQKWIENLREDYPSLYGDLPDATNIKTIEEYLRVLQAFKDGDPNRNGRTDDEIPVTAKEMEYLRQFILASYGYVHPGVELNAERTEAVFVPATEAYQRYLRTARDMYNNGRGVLDAQVFSIKTDSQMAIKGYAGRLGSFAAAAPYLIVGYEGKAEGSVETFSESDYVTIGPLTSEFYQGEPIQWGFSNFQANGAVIPMGTSKVREIARLLDIMYSELGQQLISYGVEGVDFVWDDEEKTSWTFQVPNDFIGTQEDYRATLTPNVDTASALYWNYDFVGKMNDPIITRLNQMSERYAPYLKEIFPAAVKMTIDEYTTIELVSANINVYLQSSDYNFITGVRNIDTYWDTYLARLSDFRYQDLLAAYNNAYQRYLNQN